MNKILASLNFSKILLFCFVLKSSVLSGQNFKWAKKIEDYSNNAYAAAMAYDGAGNTYITGSFDGTTDFDPDSLSTYFLNPMSGSGPDLFISKLGRNGEFKWAKQIGGTNWDKGRAIKLDAQGNIYISGVFSGSVDYDPGAGTYLLNSAGWSGVGVIKLDSGGNFVWAKTINANDLSVMALDLQGDIYMAGTYGGTTDFDPGTGVFNLSVPINYTASYIWKLNTNGNFVLAKSISGSTTSYSVFRSIFVDKKKNIYSCGFFRDSVDFNPGAGVFPLIDTSYTDIFIQKLDSAGNFKWAKVFTGKYSYNASAYGTLSNSANSISVDTSGNVFTTGYFQDTVDFDPGPGVYNLSCASWSFARYDIDIFVSKLDSNGNFIWAQKIGGIDADFARALVLDISGSVYVTGSCEHNVDFDPGPGTYFINGTTYAAYILKLSNTGSFIWARGMGGPDNVTEGIAIDVDRFGEIYTIGKFNDTTFFNPPSAGMIRSFTGYATYITRHNQCSSTTSVNTITACGKYISPSGKYSWISSGVYKDTVFNSLRCDSIITFNLTINSSSTSSISITKCSSYNSPSGKRTWTTSGTYKDTILNVKGCDSIITINLIINPSSASTINITRCNIYLSPSGKYTWVNSGLYKDTISNIKGCDSIITVNLTIDTVTTSAINVKRCNYYISPSGKYTWTTSGVYKDTLQNHRGCDSIITLTLAIGYPSVSTINAVACGNYVSPSGKYIWTNSGIYKDTILNNNSCDSIITINLTINLPSASAVNAATCKNYFSPSGRHTWVNSGVYKDTIPNVHGCDSVITINLTILTNTFSNISISRCNSYTSPSGKYVWLNNGTYRDTIPNSKGCDSIIIIQLSITKINSSIYQSNDTLFSSQPGASYQWLNCLSGYSPIPGAINNYYHPALPGSYAVKVALNTCMDTSACVSTITGVNKFAPNSLSVYPNPVTDKIHIKFDNPFSGIIQIHNLLGQVFMTVAYAGKETELSVRLTQTGFYFLTATSISGERYRLKFLKE